MMTKDEIRNLVLLELMSEGDTPNPFGLSKDEQDEICSRWKDSLPLYEMVSCVKNDQTRQKIYDLFEAIEKL